MSLLDALLGAKPTEQSGATPPLASLPSLAQQPTWADAADWHGQNLRDTWQAVQNPQTWLDAARQYGNALLMGTIAPGSAMKPSAIADRIASYADRLGYRVGRSSSQQSNSHYLELSHEALPDASLKVRVADHDLPPSYGSAGNYDVRPGDSWADVVASLADRVGADLPPSIKGMQTKEAAQAAAAQAEQMRSPAYQEAILRQAFPEQWDTAMSQNGGARSDARRRIAAMYEAANPGQIQWAPYLKPR